MADKGGRPRIIKSPEEFDRLVEEYRECCRIDEEPMTFTGMALHLGFSHRQALYEYANYDGFSDSVRKARTLIECEYEKRLQGSTQVAGSIFALKNHGWSDKQEHEHSGPGGEKLGPAVVVLPAKGEDDG